MSSETPLLEVRDLTVRFKTRDGDVQAVSDLSFSLQRGETLGVVGESGSGKSVSSLAIMGLLNPTYTDIRRRDPLRGPEPDRPEGRRAPQDPRPRHLDDLPGPVRVPASDVPRRRPDRGGGQGAREGLELAGQQARRRAARTGRHPERPRPRARLPAPVLGRHAPARDDRDGARAQPRRADRRRADDRARRDGAGADRRADRPREDGVRHRRDPDHARPRRRRGDARRT